jgi:hypothetical protein
MIYEIAGMRVQIQNRCKYTEKFCEKYLSQDQDSPFDISASVTNEEFFAEKQATPNHFSDGYIENICLYRAICRQLPTFDRMLLHAAVIKYDGKAYAFLGKSGTGKSTHTGLWNQYLKGVSVVNGDKPILQYVNDGFLAYGTPWMGKENLGENTVAPLCGLCFLEQAKENEIVKLTPMQAANRIFTQVLFPQDAQNAEKTLELLDKLVTVVPAYLLKCTISEEAVQKSFEALTGKQFVKNNEV